MLLDVVRLLLVVGLLVALPGWLLVNAALPPRRTSVRGLERFYLSFCGGALLLVLVGVLLGLLPHSGPGFFETFATGMPNVELAMALVSAGLGWIGLRRGAYPWVEARFPRLVAHARREPAPPSGLQSR